MADLSATQQIPLTAAEETRLVREQDYKALRISLERMQVHAECSDPAHHRMVQHVALLTGRDQHREAQVHDMQTNMTQMVDGIGALQTGLHDLTGTVETGFDKIRAEAKAAQEAQEGQAAPDVDAQPKGRSLELAGGLIKLEGLTISDVLKILLLAGGVWWVVQQRQMHTDLQNAAHRIKAHAVTVTQPPVAGE